MSHYLIYNNEGEIQRTVTCPESMAAMQTGAGEYLMEALATINSLTHWIYNGGVVERSPMQIAVNTYTISSDLNSSATIENVPEGTLVTWHDYQQEIMLPGDGTIELITDLAGEYTIKLDHFKYLPVEITIEAIAAT